MATMYNTTVKAFQYSVWVKMRACTVQCKRDIDISI